jgi:hypothetical protein
MDEWILETVKQILEEADKEETLDSHNIKRVLFGEYKDQIEKICEQAAQYLEE